MDTEASNDPMTGIECSAIITEDSNPDDPMSEDILYSVDVKEDLTDKPVGKKAKK